MLKPEAFESMIIDRGDRLPFKYVELHANSDSVARNYVKDLGKKHFSPKFLFFGEDSHKGNESKFDSSRTVSEGKIVCTTQKLTVPHFDVDLTDINQFQLFDDLVASVDLKGFDPHKLDDEFKAKLESALEDNYNDVVIKALEAHYNAGGTGTYLGTEFDWLKFESDASKRASDTEASSHAVSAEKNESVVKDVSPAEFKQEIKEASINKTKANEDEVDASVESENKDTKSGERLTPAPEPTNEEGMEVNTEPLTEEEEASNRVLLEKVRKTYEDCIAAIDESCNTLFVPIKNKIQDSLNTNKYACELCYMYLESSSDVSSYVYKKLYEADSVVDEFNNNVHRQYMHMGCPGCNNIWNEDITFLEKGLHEIHCPKCNMGRHIDK